jgi:hypothetical protein
VSVRAYEDQMWAGVEAVRVDELVGLMADLYSESLMSITVVASWDCEGVELK